MSNTEKEILQGFKIYAKMVNAHFVELETRIRTLEAAMEKNPQLLTAYNQAVRAEKRLSSAPTLTTQLSAIEEAIDKLPD